MREGKESNKGARAAAGIVNNVFLRAFILRRPELIARGIGDAVLQLI